MMHTVEQLCIFTPTYNRAHTLEALFESLKRQSSSDFYWLIVDDGSTDETAVLVQSLIEEASFRIEYSKQLNGGKQRAFNRGVELCTSELFFCVDSDDLLTPNTVDTILTAWGRYRGDCSVAGLIGLCGADADTPIGNHMPGAVNRSTCWDLYHKYGHRGDAALVHLTHILRSYPFWVAEGEKFIAEPYVYYQIDQKYSLGVIDRVLIIREYLADGYSANVRDVTKKNPIGYMTLKRMYIEYSDTLWLKFYNSILYLVGCRLSGTPNGVRNAPNRLIAAVAYIPSFVLCKTVYR